MYCDTVWTNAQIATMSKGMGLINDAVIAARAGKIAYVGLRTTAPRFETPKLIDCGGRLITPALIDCHTHLIYAGDRANEFSRRLLGETYSDIAKSGGGIMSTVRATRLSSQDELVQLALPRLDALLNEGLSTIEIKSGYGLTLADELKILKAAKALGQHRKVRITTTLLAAHALPPEFENQADAYIDHICADIIPEVASLGLAEAVDGFCETLGFSPAQMERIFKAAQTYSLKIKLHAEQLSNQNGARLAAQYGALSADHLEYLTQDSILDMKASGTVASLLPGAYYFMRETKRPPIELLRQNAVPMALATDHNPGSSPLYSLLMTLNMAATLFQMSVEECLLGVTLHGAMALGKETHIGSLKTGKVCDLAIWDVDSPEQLVYPIGRNPLFQRIFEGHDA